MARKMMICLIDDYASEIVNGLKKKGLKKSQYDIHLATNLEDGTKLVHDKKPDITVVDLKLPRSVDEMRCTDPECGKQMVQNIVDFNEKFGFDVEILVITAYPEDAYLISEATGAKMVLKNGKLTYMNRLLQQIDEIATHLKKKYGPYGFYNRYLDISYEGIGKFEEEKEDLLRKLFNDAKSIKIFPLIPGLSGADVFCVEWFDPEIQAFGRPCLVKVSKGKEIIDLEVRKYYNFVRNILNREYYLEIIKPAAPYQIYHTDKYSGFISSFGEMTDSKQVIEFRRFYMDEKTKVDAIKSMLRILFNDVLNKWGEKDEDVVNIVDYYKNMSCSYSGKKYFNIEKVSASYENFCSISKLNAAKESFKLSIGDDKIDVYNPSFMWDGLTESPRMHIYKKICHGDLNGRNILVCPHIPKMWLIDYVWVDRHHALFDTSRLETYIKFEVSHRHSLQDYLQLERTLLSQSSLKKKMKSPFKERNLTKTFETVMAIRNYSVPFTYQESIIEYLYSLFFHTIQCYMLEDLTPWQNELILVSSSLLFQKING